MDARVLIAAILLLAGIGIAVAGATPQSALTPSQAHQADDGPATLKGTVDAVHPDEGTFTLADPDASVLVEHGTPLPAAVEPGATIVAKGTLATEDTLRFHADEIQIGCPSQYGA